MLIYIFVDYYPNPYKPYFDTQFVEMVSQGHEIVIFAAGSYKSTINKDILKYELMDRIKFYPGAVSNIPGCFKELVLSLLKCSFSDLCTNLSLLKSDLTLKVKFLNLIRAFLIGNREPDICLIHNLNIASYFLFLNNKFKKSRVAMYYHGGEVGRTPTVSLDDRCFNSMDKVVTNTEFSKKQAMNRGCEGSKVSIVPVGFNLSDYPNKKNRSYMKGGILQIISVGRLSEEKGIFVALDAMKKLVECGVDKFQYKIIGNGYIANELKTYVDKMSLGRYVIFPGEKSSDDVSKFLGESDVLILPSLATERWSETQACVVQEAMLMKALVVTTHAGGVPESIPKEMNEFSVKPGDAHAISEKIVHIMSMSENDMAVLGEKGRRFVMDNYEIGLVTKRMLSKIISI